MRTCLEGRLSRGKDEKTLEIPCPTPNGRRITARRMPETKGKDEKENGKYQLDLWAANRRVLLEAGIKEEHLQITDICTHCNPSLLFSHRRTGEKRGNLGAFLSLKE